MRVKCFFKINVISLFLIVLVIFTAIMPVGNADAVEYKIRLSEKFMGGGEKEMKFIFCGFITHHPNAATAIFSYTGNSYQFFIPVFNNNLPVQVEIYGSKFWITDFDVINRVIQISNKPAE